MQYAGKMELCVLVPPSWEASDDLVEWDSVIAQVADMVQDNTVADVRAAFEPSFSTTTIVSTTACRVALMAALKVRLRSLCQLRLVRSVAVWLWLCGCGCVAVAVWCVCGCLARQ